MAFTDTGTVEELSLRDLISIEADDGNWVTGKVVDLSLLGDDEIDVRIGLKTKAGDTFWLDRAPETVVVMKWEEEETP
jgi:hypothetical protein